MTQRATIHDRLYGPIKRLREVAQKVICAFSCGKDALATLHLVREHFDAKDVHGYFLRTVPGLSWNVQALTYARKRFGIEISELPSPGAAVYLRNGTLRRRTARMFNLPKIGITQIQDYLRKKLDWPDAWIATGEKANDSIVRRGMISKWGAVDEKHKRAYPCAFWSDHYVLHYIKQHKIPLTQDYNVFAGSLDFALEAENLLPIRERFPDDYAKMLAYFPWLELEIKSYERRPERQRKTKTPSPAQEHEPASAAVGGVA